MGELFSYLGSGFANLMDVTRLLLVLMGVCVGILGGAIPGISPSMAVALLLPMTYKMDPTTAIVMLMGIYIGANYGGSITAVSINTPGTPSAAVTAFDGYPLAKNGRAGEAMGISLWASTFGGLIGTLVLIFFSIPLAQVALKFWPSEYFALCIMGLTTVATLGGKEWQKALAMVLFGLMLNTIGKDPMYSINRFIWGSTALYDGIPMIPILIGLFALGELFSNLENYEPGEKKEEQQKADYKLPKMGYYWKLKWSILRCGLLGCVIGIFPGAGGTIASFLAYDVEKHCSKEPQNFGHGAPEGVAAAEASNSGSVGGAMVPLLSLGIPGSSTAAVLIGALMIHNLTPGPELFTKNPELVYTLFASMFVAHVIMAAVGVLGSNLWVRVTAIPKTILYPLIFAFSILGSYAVEKNIVHVVCCLIFGVIGWMLKKYRYPAAPVVLGVVLGKLMEKNFSRIPVVGKGSWAGLYNRPLTIILFVISIAAIVWPMIQDRVKGNKNKN